MADQLFCLSLKNCWIPYRFSGHVGQEVGTKWLGEGGNRGRNCFASICDARPFIYTVSFFLKHWQTSLENALKLFKNKNKI